MKTQTPFIPPDLVTFLGKAFPDKLPRHSTSAEAFHMLIGEQRVLDFLRKQLDLQQEPQRNL